MWFQRICLICSVVFVIANDTDSSGKLIDILQESADTINSQTQQKENPDALDESSGDSDPGEDKFRIGLLEMAVKNIGEDLVEVKEETGNLETELKDDVEDVEDQMRQNSDRVTNAERDVVANIRDISSLTNTLNRILDRVNSLEQTNARQQTTINQLKNTNTILVENIRQQESTLAQQRSTIAQHMSFIAQQGDILAQLDEAIYDLQNGTNTVSFLPSVNRLAPWEACSSSPCKNLATCVDVNVDTYVCMCRDGFYGKNCEQTNSNTAFMAVFSTHPVSSIADPIVFDNDILNPGNQYDKTTGIYTAPRDGIYQFMVHYRNANDRESGLYLVVDDVRVANTYAENETWGYSQADLVFLISLTAGQEVWISPYSVGALEGTGRDGIISSWFSGHLVQAL